jgi:hypothetical protein
MYRYEASYDRTRPERDVGNTKKVGVNRRNAAGSLGNTYRSITLGPLGGGGGPKNYPR